MIGLLLAAILVFQPAQRTNPLLQGGTVTGRVLTADGIPAAAIRVSAMQAPASSSRLGAECRGQTGGYVLYEMLIEKLATERNPIAAQSMDFEVEYVNL